MVQVPSNGPLWEWVAEGVVQVGGDVLSLEGPLEVVHCGDSRAPDGLGRGVAGVSAPPSFPRPGRKPFRLHVVRGGKMR